MNKIKLGMIGFGFRARGISYNLQKQLNRYDVVAICDVKKSALDEAKKMWGDNVMLLSSYEKLLEIDEIEAVIIAIPQFAHKEAVISSFSANKHVYCEKPMAITVSACNEMIKARDKAGKIFIIGQQMRYHMHLQKMSQLIKGNEIGRPIMAWLKEFRNPFPETMLWVFDKKKSGGMLTDKNCHHFDVFNWFIGSRPIRVFASGAADVYPEIFGIKSNVADNAWVIVEYENGSRAMLGICMFAGLPYKYEAGIGMHMREIGVAGDKGILRTEGFDLGTTVELKYADSRNVTRYDFSDEGNIPGVFNQNGNQGIFIDFAECIRTGRTPFASAEIGREALAMSLAGEKSMEEKRIVEISEIK